MSETLPDGFTQRDEWGRVQHPVDKIPKSERDAFAHSGIAFDGEAAVESAIQRQANIESAVAEALKNMDPELKKEIGEE